MFKNFIKSFFEANKVGLKWDWRLIKTLIKEEIRSRNFEQALKLTEEACNLAYTYNFVPNYWDLEIEQSIQTIAKAIQKDNLIEKLPIENRVVFFDYFVLENRGFTQQYLDAFIDSGVEILYIIDDPKNFNRQNRIIQTVERYEKGTITILNSSTRIAKLNELFSVVTAFNPSKVFIHTAPWEILSCCLADALRSSTTIQCYLLNISDDRFWPGITCFEYIIDFRSYGHNINKLLKGKVEDKLIIIPTPAYLDKIIPFQGFPEIVKDKVIGFSGGSYYKIVDENNTFLHLIKDLIYQNEKFVFLFACIGGEEKINQFIKDFKLENRFILIGNRRDISMVFENIDIYFNTYPYGGGLMMHYALRYRKPIMALWKSGLYNARLDLVLDCQLSEDHIILEKNKYLETASRLINDPNYRYSYINYFEQAKESINDFSRRIRQLLDDSPVDPVHILDFSINQRAVTDFHIECERLRKRVYILMIYEIFQYLPLMKRPNVTFRYWMYRLIKKYR